LPCSSGISPLPVTHPTGHAMTGCRPPPGISLASPWSRVVHNGFGSYTSDCRHFHTLRLTCCAHSLSLRLSPCHLYTLPGSCFKKNDKTLFHATRISLSAFSFVALHNFHALPSCHHLVSDLFNPTRVGAFHLSLTLLVRYRSIVNI